ncbi:MAG TPA: DUF434 domain-containing protein [Mobilitalea sp.]|nr:DUF434 domain-containing protein [Mobilitalea sp.]
MTNARRGFVPNDEKEFNKESIALLKRAQQDILYLIERGYPIKGASTFVGNHYLLSERQRLALVRATATRQTIALRKSKQLDKKQVSGKVVIDGLNTIITLEVALSYGTLVKCMDGTIRDLAGLRGTYRLIDETQSAILMIGEHLSGLNINEAVFYLDSPVSNTGRLKTLIFETLGGFPYKVNVEILSNVDVVLEGSNQVITSDAIILNKCGSWYNLAAYVIAEKLPHISLIDLS